jgi:hypothetical protein
MRRRALPLFLAFLLVSGIADDLFASFTADPQDDVLAAANNTYLSGRAAHDQLRDQGGIPPSPGGLPAVLPDRPAAAPGPGRSPGRAAVPRTGTDLRYNLMSLQL